jgi:hypothetical protein
MAATSEKLGRGACPFKGCDEPVTFRRSSGGKLTFKCDACDQSGFSEPGGVGYTAALATIKRIAAPTPAPAPEMQPELPPNRIPEPTKTSPKKPASGGFFDTL